jgi:hypothetical protein
MERLLKYASQTTLSVTQIVPITACQNLECIPTNESIQGVKIMSQFLSVHGWLNPGDEARPGDTSSISALRHKAATRDPDNFPVHPLRLWSRDVEKG